MALTQTTKLMIIISSILVASAAIVTPTTIYLVNKNNAGPEFITVTLLDNAGVMINTSDVRIYVDPYNIPISTYSDLPADIILVTHDHGDHFDPYVIDFLKTDDTTIILPEIMSTSIVFYDALGGVPGDTFQIGEVKITCFYMYTFPPEGYEASHPQESNYTSYIIEVRGMTFFHSGDAGNIPEYSQLDGLIDVAFLPLGPGCQTMVDMDVVYALDAIGAEYFIPIHYAYMADVTFCSTYTTNIENLGCELIHLAYFESYIFE